MLAICGSRHKHLTAWAAEAARTLCHCLDTNDDDDDNGDVVFLVIVMRKTAQHTYLEKGLARGNECARSLHQPMELYI